MRRVAKPTFAPGDSAHRMAVEVGYPKSDGTLAWKGGEFTRNGGPDQRWEPEFVMWRAGEVANPPADWTPDETWVRRRVIFDQDSDIGADIHNRSIVEQDEMLVDGPDGRKVSDIAIDVRSEDGTLDILMQLDTFLEGPRQRVEVEIKPSGQDWEGNDRPVQRFVFNAHDQYEPRRLKIYTGQPDYAPNYEYRVTAMIMAGLGESGGRRWTGPWEPGLGNGPITVSVPAPDAPGVVSRNLSMAEVLGESSRPTHATNGDQSREPGENLDWPAPAARLSSGVAEVSGYTMTKPANAPSAAGNGDRH